MAKFHEATPPGSNVLVANTLNFKPISDPPLKKNCKGIPVPGGGALVGLKSFSSACKKFGGAAPSRG